MDTILSNPEIKVAVLQADVKIKYKVHMSKQKIYRANKRALISTSIDHEESYKKIRNYAQIILDKMSQATAFVKVNITYT